MRAQGNCGYPKSRDQENSALFRSAHCGYFDQEIRIIAHIQNKKLPFDCTFKLLKIEGHLKESKKKTPQLRKLRE